MVLSIQPLSSRAPSDETYQYHWNPTWEPFEDGIPFWDHPSPRGSVPQVSSDMNELSPTTTDDSVATSGEIPTPTDPIHVSSTPTTTNLPLGYKALRDATPSGTPFTGPMWSSHTFPTTEPFTPQSHGLSVTSVTTVPTVCAAPLTSIYSRPSASLFGVFDPMKNVSMQESYDPYFSSQPIVEVSVPLSIDWTSTSFHGGQVLSAQSPIQPPQDQLGQSIYGNPFVTAAPFSSLQPSGNSGQLSFQQVQPGIQQSYPAGQSGQQSVNLNQSNVQYSPMSRQGTQTLGQPTVQYSQPSGQIGQPQTQLVQPTAQSPQPSSLLGQPSTAQQPFQQVGQPQY